MTIRELLMDREGAVYYLRNRWLFRSRTNWIVMEHPPGARESITLIETDDEEEAVRILIGGT